MSYLRPDAYRRPSSPALIPEDSQVPRPAWGWRKYALAGASVAGVGLGWQALKLPYSTGVTRYLDLGIGEAQTTWRQLVGGQLELRDVLLSALKGFEEETPFYLGRTFGLSEFLSPYVLGKRARLDIPFEVLQQQRRYYEALIPGFRVDAYERLRLEGGRLYGFTPEGQRRELLGYARARLSHWAPPRLPDIEHPPLHGRLSQATQQILARSRGLDDRVGLISKTDTFPFHIVGSARAPWRHYLREAQGLAEMWNRRFFRLLDDPLELFADLGVQAQGIPGLQRAGSWLRRTGLVNRFGLGGDYSGNILSQWGRWLRPGFNRAGGFRPGALLTFVGAPFAYRALDQYFRDHEAYQGTIVEHGLSGAAASVWQKAMLARARFGQLTGLSALARAQEDIAPGSTDLGAMLGLPLAGGVLGGLYGFARSRLVRPDDLTDVWRRIKLPTHRFTGAFARIFRGKYTHTGKMIRGGLALGALLEAPFLLGAGARLLGGLKSPEELRRIYSGQEEIPVRRGRWWEFGCLGPDTEVPVSFTDAKRAADIKIGDPVIARDGSITSVTHIWERPFSGKIIKFTTALDRNRPTSLTGNHMVPVLRKYKPQQTSVYKEFIVEEVRAETINRLDFVEVPIPRLPENTEALQAAAYLTGDKFIIKDGLIRAGQINWATGKVQVTSSKPIPAVIPLNEDTGRLFGYFLAEGNISYGKDRWPHLIETVHAKKEKWIVDDIIQICQKQFSITPTVRFKTTGKRTKEGCWVVRICSSVLANVFQGLFYSTGDKQLPEIFLSGSKTFKQALVDGYWYGDGCINKGCRQIKSARPQLIYAIQAILLSLGYCPTITKQRDNSHRGEIAISWREDRSQQDWNQSFLWFDGRLYTQIVALEIEKIECQVYDFEVADKEHLFAAGTFLVHNSSYYKGEKPEYYRPHWTVLAKSDYLNKSLFRGDESWLFKAAKRTPILTDIIDPYYLERLHYRDRPYPLTGPSYPGLGAVGSLYAATLGRLLKPVRTMHAEEWQLEGGVKYQQEEHAPVLELGGLPPAMPESPYSLKRTAAETWHRWTEAIGLPGWLLRLGTGSEKWGAQGLQYASAERMVSEERQYWDANLGGLMGATEWYRRINVRRRTAVGQQQYNPLRNTMPSWLPGGDYFINFREGDPFKIPRGEARLPGPGYAALHPELAGVRPEDYPLLHRLKILADVAPYADQTRQHLIQAQALKKAGQLSEAEATKLADIKRQLAAVKKRKEFEDYRDWTEVNFFARGPGRYWELLTHQAGNLDVAETLLPLRPLAKFIHKRDPLEDYEHSIVHGADQGFWNRPWANFIRPALERTEGLMGDESIPRHVQRLRETEEYFDKLKYLKARMHAARARAAGDTGAAASWNLEAQKTLTGLEPWGSQENILGALSALPKRERDYYQAFSREEDPKRQEKILSLVPENVGRLYRLIWERNALSKLETAEAQDKLAGKEAEIRELKAALLADMKSGSRATPALLQRYREESPDLPLGDWLREQELLEFFRDRPLPGPAWLGWDPRLDLEDIKLKVVQNQGQDFHDYNLWESRERTLARKPYLEEAMADLAAAQRRDPEEVRRQIRALCEDLGLKDLQVEVTPAATKGEAKASIIYDSESQLREHLAIIEYASRKPKRRAEPPERRRTRQRNERPL